MAAPASPAAPASETPRSLGVVVGGAGEEGPGSPIEWKAVAPTQLVLILAVNCHRSPKTQSACFLGNTTITVHVHLAVDLRLEMSQIHPR